MKTDKVYLVGFMGAGKTSVGRALAKSPANRYASAGDLGRAALAAAAGEPATEPGRSVARGGGHREPDEQEREEQRQNAAGVHAVHLPPGARTSGCFGGPPRRQKISGSMLSG